MSVEGRLQIDLYPVAGRVNIQSSRPLQAARVFEGKTPDVVLMQLPLLYSVCGVAQATAAVQAFQQALTLAASAAVETARAMLVQMETAREHLWRILIDWPALLEASTDARRTAPLATLLPAFRKALFADGEAFSLHAEPDFDAGALQAQIGRLDEMLSGLVFGCTPSQWLRINSVDQLDDWTGRTESVAARLLRQVSRDGWRGLGAVDNDFLPELPVAGLNQRLQAANAHRFIAEPVWQDRTCETTPLSRQCDGELIDALYREFGSGLLTRLAARLVELARIPATLRTLAEQPDSAHCMSAASELPAGIGIGQVEAARGHLVHRVVLADGCVHGYQILAPTEWNFHPAGVVARGLRSLPETDETTLRRQAALLINAVDPCVGYDVQVH